MSAYHLFNTLYFTTGVAYLYLDSDTARIEVGRETRLRMPLHHLGGIVSRGDVTSGPSSGRGRIDLLTFRRAHHELA